MLERLVALESKITTDAEGAEAVAVERRWNLLDRLLRQASALRSMLVTNGIAAVTEREDAAEEETCWAELGEDTDLRGSWTKRGGGDELILKARARYTRATVFILFFSGRFRPKSSGLFRILHP